MDIAEELNDRPDKDKPGKKPGLLIKIIAGAFVIAVILFAIFPSSAKKLFKGALLGNTVGIPAECENLLTTPSQEVKLDDGRLIESKDSTAKTEEKTWKTMVVLLRDVNLKISDSKHEGDDYLDSKLSQDEAIYFCTRFKEFKDKLEKDTPLKLEVLKVVDYRNKVQKITKAETKSVIGGKDTTTIDWKISSEQLPFNEKTSSLYFKPGTLDNYFVVYDNGEFVNILYKADPEKKLHAAATTYQPSSLTNGAIAIFIQAKENWIQKDYDLVHALTHEFSHAITIALNENNIETMDLHGYGQNYEKGSLSKDLPSENWVYEDHKTNDDFSKKSAYQIEDEFKDYIFKNIIGVKNYWNSVKIRDKGAALARVKTKSGNIQGDEAYQNRVSANIVEVPIFQKDQDHYTVIFTTQAVENRKFGYLMKQKQTNDISEYKSEDKLINDIKPEWILEEYADNHAADARIHQDFPDLPHYSEPHQHFILNIPLTIKVGQYIKIWAFTGENWTNPETSAALIDTGNKPDSNSTNKVLR